MKLSLYLSLTAVLLLSLTPAAEAGLFAGLENGTAISTMFTDLNNFPDVTWTPYYSINVLGAAATPEDTLYICNGSFNTDLYKATLDMSPVFIADISESMQSLAFGRDTLWGFSNFASQKGIYSIDTQTGVASFEIDTYTGTSYRFFGLAYNPIDDLLYGYTEYGDNGLYSINIDTEEMIKIADVIPATNAQGRGLAVGNNIVYLTGTRGDDGIPCYSYDLTQGTNGEWVEFTNPYPAYHSTGGAAWLSDNSGVADENSAATPHLLISISPNPTSGQTTFSFEIPLAGNTSLSIYDASGRIQSTIINTVLNAGINEMPWNADLPAGVYIAILKNNTLISAQRFVVVR